MQGAPHLAIVMGRPFGGVERPPCDQVVVLQLQRSEAPRLVHVVGGLQHKVGDNGIHVDAAHPQLCRHHEHVSAEQPGSCMHPHGMVWELARAGKHAGATQ